MTEVLTVSNNGHGAGDTLAVHAIAVTRTYSAGGKPVQALRGVNLEVPRGTLTALMGRSGSGKTTLLNIIGGLDRPTSGEVLVDGEKFSRLSDRALADFRRHRLGFVFQSFALLPTYSAYENVELPLRMIGVGRKERGQRVRFWLETVGLADWASHRPYELSGGQQQRLAIARALVNRPHLVLADEPTGELDTTTGRQILALFKEIVEREGVTILIATHDPKVREVATVVHQLRDGQIVVNEAERAPAQ
ncbi:MAG: ABC transporter ATP-binding protein [Anaerolineae bacterium]|nr:ABC transporter ATP-binding protein [Anaerolineae bacterium]